jgi:hypothetical protein
MQCIRATHHWYKLHFDQHALFCKDLPIHQPPNGVIIGRIALLHAAAALFFTRRNSSTDATLIAQLPPKPGHWVGLPTQSIKVQLVHARSAPLVQLHIYVFLLARVLQCLQQR